jgi:ATPase family associated with various cellular activities (AAA)
MLSASARHVAERLAGPLFLGCSEAERLDRPSLRFDVSKPPPTEQKHLWQRSLGSVAEELSDMVDDLSEQFRLSAKAIFTNGAVAVSAEMPLDGGELWDACRALARPKLEELAQRIVPAAGWEDLVLPEPQLQTLRQLADQVRHRMQVYETWGFSDKGRRGLGVSALFAGVSGTGKTLAAEVLARELRLDLYRIDLSRVVSKYIGESAKNMKQVFDAGEEGGVLLLFDEADALFGKRSEVKDSHDRYANIDVGYLLQRMETFQGLAILTTNLKSSLDRSFQRRLRFTVTFPFPDAVQREAIWDRVFPGKTSTRGLQPKRLAQLNMAGGNIRNIAMNAFSGSGRWTVRGDGTPAARGPAGGGQDRAAAGRQRDQGVGVSRVRVTIDRLVLKGLDPAQQRALVEGLQGELARVLGEPWARGDWTDPRYMPVLRFGRMQAKPGKSGGRTLGLGIGGGIARGLKM